MLRLALIGLLALPGAAMAQDKAAMCVSVAEALRAIEGASAQITDDAADFHAEMLAMRDRIGGADGAALEVRSERHMLNSASALRELAELASDARENLTAYCAP